MDRKPFVAGRFYPASKKMLLEELGSYSLADKNKQKAIGIVSPHAGYVYSGAVAGEVFSSVQLPSRFVVLSPNHTGMGLRISMWPSGSWQTPLGEAVVDEDLCSKIASKSDAVKQDTEAHLMEHSLEVQIPFIQYHADAPKIVPITLSNISLDECARLGNTLGSVIESEKDEILIIASSDMTHFEDAKSAKSKDDLAIERIVNMDPEGLYNVVRDNDISMCGMIPTACMLFAARHLGGKKGTLVKYSNSGETSGDYDQVVGYAGLYVS